METMTSSRSFEQNLKSLEKIVEKLESGSVSLDEAIGLFQKGKTLGKACESRLKEVEMKIQQLVENEKGDLSVEAFEPNAEAPEESESLDTPSS